MKSANSDVSTARKIHMPVRAGAGSSGPADSRPAAVPCASHGRAVRRRTISHQITMPLASAANATETFTLSARCYPESLASKRSMPAVAVPMRLRRARLRLDAGRWLVLRHEVIHASGHAVLIGPAIDDRQLRTPVAVLRRRVRRKPLDRRRAPGVAARRLAVLQAPEQVEQEDRLRRRDDE